MQDKDFYDFYDFIWTVIDRTVHLLEAVVAILTIRDKLKK